MQAYYKLIFMQVYYVIFRYKHKYCVSLTQFEEKKMCMKNK